MKPISTFNKDIGTETQQVTIFNDQIIETSPRIWKGVDKLEMTFMFMALMPTSKWRRTRCFINSWKGLNRSCIVKWVHQNHGGGAHGYGPYQKYNRRQHPSSQVGRGSAADLVRWSWGRKHAHSAGAIQWHNKLEPLRDKPVETLKDRPMDTPSNSQKCSHGEETGWDSDQSPVTPPWWQKLHCPLKPQRQ